MSALAFTEIVDVNHAKWSTDNPDMVIAAFEKQYPNESYEDLELLKSYVYGFQYYRNNKTGSYYQCYKDSFSWCSIPESKYLQTISKVENALRILESTTPQVILFYKTNLINQRFNALYFEWKQLVQTTTTPNVEFTEFDCSVMTDFEQALQKQFAVSAYSTLKIYKNGELFEFYGMPNGLNTIERLNQFLTNALDANATDIAKYSGDCAILYTTPISKTAVQTYLHQQEYLIHQQETKQALTNNCSNNANDLDANDLDANDLNKVFTSCYYETANNYDTKMKQSFTAFSGYDFTSLTNIDFRPNIYLHSETNTYYTWNHNKMKWSTLCDEEVALNFGI